MGRWVKFLSRQKVRRSRSRVEGLTLKGECLLLVALREKLSQEQTAENHVNAEEAFTWWLLLPPWGEGREEEGVRISISA
jgi:hypothetical protein